MFIIFSIYFVGGYSSWNVAVHKLILCVVKQTNVKCCYIFLRKGRISTTAESVHCNWIWQARYISSCCHRATVVLCRHLKGLLAINADGRTCLSQSREHQEKAACSEVLDLSCSQHVLFGLEIHKSFDCFSLPDMSFQSDSFRAIPPPGFVIYISTIVWSPDFEERGNRFYPAWPHLSAPEIKENIQPLSKKFTSATCVIFTHISFSKHYLFSPVSNTTEPLLFSQGGGGRPWRNYFLVCCEHRVMFFQESSFNIEEMKIFFCLFLTSVKSITQWFFFLETTIKIFIST